MMNKSSQMMKTSFTNYENKPHEWGIQAHKWRL
jgi:hypothetical protein